MLERREGLLSRAGRPLCGVVERPGAIPCRRLQAPGLQTCASHARANAAVTPIISRRYRPRGPEAATAYAIAASDPHVASSREEAALVSVQIQRLLDRMPSDEDEEARVGELWRALGALAAVPQDEFDALEDDAARVVASLRAALAGVQRDQIVLRSIWGDLAQAIELRARVARSEIEYVRAMSEIVTREEMTRFCRDLEYVLRRHIANRETLAAVASGIRSIAAPLVGRPSDS